MAEHPEIRIVWSGVSTEICGICGREWEQGAIEVPSAYTAESIDADDVPVPVCDLCIEEHYPGMFDDLLADRRRFFAS